MWVSKVLGLQRPRPCHVMLVRVGGCPLLIVLQMVYLLPFETFPTLEGKGEQHCLDARSCSGPLSTMTVTATRLLEGWLQPLTL